MSLSEREAIPTHLRELLAVIKQNYKVYHPLYCSHITYIARILPETRISPVCCSYTTRVLLVYYLYESERGDPDAPPRAPRRHQAELQGPFLS